MSGADTQPRQPDLKEVLGRGQATGLWARLKRPLLWGGIILIAVIARFAWFNRATDDVVQYKTQPTERGDLTVIVSATGTLEPTNQVNVGIEVSGTIRTVAVDYNDTVKAGQVLARLDTTKLEDQLLQSKAALQAARAGLQQTRATLKNAASNLARLRHAHELSGGRVPSQQDLDAAEAALAKARADVASAQANIEQKAAIVNANQTDLGKAVVRSPINGIVLVRAVDPGQTVAASFQTPTLFTLAEDLTQMELHVDVDEADVGKVQQGQTASFTVDAYPDRNFPSQVTQVRFGAQAVAGVVTYETVMTVDNASLLLRPGMTATANIVVHTISDALLIPNAALRFAPSEAQQTANNHGGSLLSQLMPRPPRSAKKGRRNEAAGKEAQARVWTLRDGQLQPVDIRIGATDGIKTVMTAGTIEPGTPLVVDQVTHQQ